MPVTTSYATESELASFLDAELGPVADALEWTVGGGSYSHAIALALRAGGWDSIDAVDDTAGIERLAIREAWRLAVKHLSAYYDFSIDQQSVSRSQMQKMALAALDTAEREARPYDTVLAVTVTQITVPTDPYGVRLDLLEGLGGAE